MSLSQRVGLILIFVAVIIISNNERIDGCYWEHWHNDKRKKHNELGGGDVCQKLMIFGFVFFYPIILVTHSLVALRR